MKIFFLLMILLCYPLFAKEAFIFSIFSHHEEYITYVLYGLLSTVIIGTSVFIAYLYWSRKILVRRKKELIRLSESLNTAQEIAHLGNWIWDIRANTLWWSDEIYRIFGLSPQEFKADYDAFLSYVHPDDRGKIEEAVDTSIHYRTPYSIKHRIIRSDGTIRHVHEEGYVLYEDEQPSKIHGTVLDITDQLIIQNALEDSKKKYKSLVDNAMVGIYKSDLSGNLLYVNQMLVKMLGYESANELYTKKSMEIYKDPAQRALFIQKLSISKTITNYEVDLLDRAGNPLPIMVSATLDEDTLSGMMIDMREIKKSREEVDKLSKVVEQIDDAVMLTDKNGEITYVNFAFSELTGYSKKEALGKTPKILKSGQYDNAFYKNLWKIILSGNVFRITMTNRKKNGEIFYENKTISPLKDEKDDIVGFASSGKDVTTDMMMHQEMERIANTDKLTGIYNRHKFEEIFALEAERSHRFSQPLSLMLIDIDHFKAVNDLHGHDIGDEVLKTLVKIIQENIRKIDTFSRWGGEEFLILSPGTDLNNTRLFAEKLRSEVERSSFPKIGNITISIGISTLTEKDTFSELFKRADKGLYHAKEHGRNQIGVL